MNVILLSDNFTLCKLKPDAALPSWLNYKGYTFVSRSPDELSIICSEKLAPKQAQTELNLKCLQIDKPKDSQFRKVRVDIVNQVSNAGLHTFIVSTYGKDYLVFAAADLPQVEKCIQNLGHQLVLQAE